MEPQKKWHILYCDRLHQLCPVTDFIESCSQRHQLKLLRFLELLEELGPGLKRPYADLLHDGVHELRITLGGDHARILYFFCFEKFIILYHAFWKRTDKVPEQIIRETIEYRKNLINRFNKKALEYFIDENFQEVSSAKTRA